MATSQPGGTNDAQRLAAELPPPAQAVSDGLNIRTADEGGEKLVDAIEMLGEEEAAGLRQPAQHEVTAGMRYLHCSRTIHQLVTDRNRAVGIYLAFASLLLTASGAIFHAHPAGDLIIPVEKVQKWCLPITFATLAVLAVLTAFLLIRTRAGLIYEVAKMNALLGLPVGRVSRVQPLSIFFIMQTIISLAGGLSGGLFSIFMVRLVDPEAEHLGWIGFFVGLAITIFLLILYVVTVAFITSDKRLTRLGK